MAQSAGGKQASSRAACIMQSHCKKYIFAHKCIDTSGKVARKHGNGCQKEGSRETQSAVGRDAQPFIFSVKKKQMFLFFFFFSLDISTFLKVGKLRL